jgi:NAD(P)-dependent dehydrogenase (short-subunit alcohol dehydrogenase family)
MGIFTAATVAAITGGSTIFLRRRISRNWIDCRKIEHDLGGKVIVITGGNTGLGYETAKDLSRRNGTIVLGCRDLSSGQKAANSISKTTGNKVECLELDLASLRSVRSFISQVQSAHPSINVLICNAGVWVPMEKKNKTKDGFETHFGINHLSHFLICRSLTEQLATSGNGRIVFVSSSLSKSGKLDFESKDFIHEGRKDVSDSDTPKKKSYSAPTGYCDSKLMNAITSRYLSTILPPSVATYTICPGFCRSSLGRHVSIPFYQKLMVAPLMSMIQRTTVQGSQNSIFAVIEDKGKLESGAFYRDGKISNEHTDYIDSLGTDLPRNLFELSETLLQEEQEE